MPARTHWILLLLLVLVPPLATAAQSPPHYVLSQQADRASPALQLMYRQAREHGRVPVLVTLKVRRESPRALLYGAVARDATARIAQAQDAVLQRLYQHVGSITPPAAQARGLKRFQTVPAFAIQATAQDLDALLADPMVERVALDRLLRSQLAESVPLIGAGADGSFAGFSGAAQTAALPASVAQGR